jgi:hypothetical protein
MPLFVYSIPGFSLRSNRWAEISERLRRLTVRRRCFGKSKHLSSLAWRRYFSIQFVINSNRSFNQLSITRRFLTAPEINIVFQTNACMSSHQYRERRQRQLKRPNG